MRKLSWGGERVIDFRASPLRLQLQMCFGPIRLSVASLFPTHQGGFVAPFEELPHSLSMRSGHHKLLHCGFGCPYGAGPECAITVTEQ